MSKFKLERSGRGEGEDDKQGGEGKWEAKK